MKKFILLLLLLAIFNFVYAVPEMGFALDLGTAQDLIKKQSYQFHLDYRVSLSEDFEARLPVSFTIAGSSWIADAGLSLAYYPFGRGLFFSISAVEFGYWDKSFKALNEISTGFSYVFGKHWLVEGEVCVRDPSGAYSDEYSDIRGAFPSYSTFRIRIKAGFKFFTKDSKK